MDLNQQINNSEKPNDSKTFNYRLLNPMYLIIIILVIVALYIFPSPLGTNPLKIPTVDVSSLSSGNSSFEIENATKLSSNNSLVNTAVYLMLVILLIGGIILLGHYYKFSFTNKLSELFNYTSTNTPNTDTNTDTNTTNSDKKKGKSVKDIITDLPSTILQLNKKQVFNISGNEYTYDDAKAICKAYGADLASYSQLEDAYNNGADWCNYGWSDGQMALFPTQQKTFDHLQTIKGHEQDCGRPGINGGFKPNPKIKFGVNCYGKKPKMSKYENDVMKTISPYPQTNEEKEFNNKVEYWKTKINDLLISPFNNSSWVQV